MFENIIKFFKNIGKKEEKSNETENSKDSAKERLHLVLMQDRANVSADFLDLMRQEIIEVIKKYIDIDEEAMDVRLGSETNEDGTQGAPALYANIPIINIKDETRKLSKTNQEKKVATNIIPHEEEKIIEETKETVIENENAEEKEEVKEPKEEKETPEKSEKVSEKSKENKNIDENEIPKNEKNKIKKEVEKKDEN